MSKQQHPVKIAPVAIKSISNRTVDGVFSVFGVRDSEDDMTHPGSFAKTIQERAKAILHLWSHDTWSPAVAAIESLEEIGRDDLGDKILAGYPEATGGALVRRTYLDTPRGNEILAGYQAGIPYQMSYGYDIVKADFQEVEDGMIRHLREIKLWETSDVLWGMLQATEGSKAAMFTAHAQSLFNLDTFIGQVQAVLSGLKMDKAGQRNAAADLARIETIALMAYELGATNVALVAPEADGTSDDETDDMSNTDGKGDTPEADTDTNADDITKAEPDRKAAQLTLELLLADFDLLTI